MVVSFEGKNSIVSNPQASRRCILGAFGLFSPTATAVLLAKKSWERHQVCVILAHHGAATNGRPTALLCRGN